MPCPPSPPTTSLSVPLDRNALRDGPGSGEARGRSRCTSRLKAPNYLLRRPWFSTVRGARRTCLLGERLNHEGAVVWVCSFMEDSSHGTVLVAPVAEVEARPCLPAGRQAVRGEP